MRLSTWSRSVLSASFLLLATWCVTASEDGVSSTQSSNVADGKYVLAAACGADTSDLTVINAQTGEAKGYILAGHLGSIGGGLFDVVVSPDGKTAVVSNFGDGRLNFIDVSDPWNPVFKGWAWVPFFAEDLDITADGRYVLVTDGGFSPRIASYSMQTMSLVHDCNLRFGASAQSVAISPNGTVLAANYFNRSLEVLSIDEDGQITQRSSHQDQPHRGSPDWPEWASRPVNVVIAPDGVTALVLGATSSYVIVYKITGPGQVELMGFVTGLANQNINYLVFPYGTGLQSAAFSLDGKRAYVNWIERPDNSGVSLTQWIAVFRILGPGVVVLEEPRAAMLPLGGTSQFFGVDHMTIASGKLFMGNPTLSGGRNFVTSMDLSTYHVEKLPARFDWLPTGLATIPSGCAVTVAPASQTVPEGGSATLTANVTGGTPISYQWYAGASGDTSNPIGGAVSSMYTTGALAAGSYQYWVQVVTSCGTVSSGTATVTAGGANITRVNSKTHKPGSTATLIGTGFSATKSQNTIYVGGVKVSQKQMSRVSTTKIRFTLPTGLAPGWTQIYVEVNGVPSNVVDFEVK